MAQAAYFIYVVDPTKEVPGTTGVYKYEPIDQLSRLALIAISERSTDSGGTNPLSDATEQGIMDGTIVPADSALLYSATPLITNDVEATSYLGAVITVPQTISVTVNSQNRGVVVGGTECFGAVLNHTRSGNDPDHHLLAQANLSNDALRGASSVPFGGQIALGDEVEVFLFDASSTPVFGAPANPTYAELDALTRFAHQPGSSYSWVYTQTYIVDSLDEVSPGVQVNMFKGLKPYAASDENYDVDVIIENNPTLALSDGLEVAVNNKTQNGSTTATDVGLTWVTVDTSFGASFEGLAMLTVSNPGGFAVEECDELEFFVRVLGDSTNTKTFTVTAPAAPAMCPAPAAGCVPVSATDITVTEKTTARLVLDSFFGLQIDNVIIQGSAFRPDETTPANSGGVMEMSIVCDTNSFTTEVANTSDGDAPLVPYVSPTYGAGQTGFQHQFVAGDFVGGAGIRFIAGQTRVLFSVRDSSNTLTSIDFYPRLDAADRGGDPLGNPTGATSAKASDITNDGTHGLETVLLDISMITSTAGVVTATLDLDTQFGRSGFPTYHNGFALVTDFPSVPASGPVQFSGDVINGPPPGSGTAIPDSELELTLYVHGETQDFTQTILNLDADVNGEYDFTASAALSGWTRDLQVGDIVTLELRDTTTVGNPIIAIASASPVAGTIEPGTNLYPVGTGGNVAPPVGGGTIPAGAITFSVTSAMITTGHLSEVGSGSEDLLLAAEYGVLNSVTKFTFQGVVFQPDGTNPSPPPSVDEPIPDGAKMFIRNVTKGLSRVVPIGPNGAYTVTFLDTDFGLPSGSLVAEVNDTIHYIVFEDVGTPITDPNGPYPDPAVDNILRSTGDTLGADVDVSATPGANPGQFAVVGTLSLAEVQFASTETPPRGEKTEDFHLNERYTPVAAEEIIVVSTPIDTGTKIPLRALPYVDVVFPTNVVGGVPFEFEVFLSNNANDAVPRFDPVTSVADMDFDTPGPVFFPGSVHPLRLHIYTSTDKTATTHAVAIKVRMKRNDADGDFQLNSYGVRWWHQN